ncbi:MAG: hypothetical protein U5K30_02480 [Acidimicrobiales bacterium]|nr:hypothetical protein [Acidimicrobiales bacterium]
MVIAVRTERGATGLEVVKVADDDAGRARLAHEAEVLRRATHPGIVEVIGTTESTLRLRHRGTPLARLGAIAPDHGAAIIRAVADIVDSMHQQGLVHRRIDADHVVVNERGRPHLCGFGEAGPGDEDEQADDVAALGRLLDRLLDDSAEALWSPAHRGVRAAPRRKRSLAAFRTAAAGAQRESAGQRLTARQFATAIGDALPGLSLPTPPGSRTGTGDDDADDTRDIDPTADVGWSDLDLSMLAIDEDFDTAAVDPTARVDPYARLADLAGPDPDVEPDPERDPVPGATPAEDGWDEEHSAAVDDATSDDAIDWGDLEPDRADDGSGEASGPEDDEDREHDQDHGQIAGERGDRALAWFDFGGEADHGERATQPAGGPDPIVAALRAALEAAGTEWRSAAVDETTEPVTGHTAEQTAEQPGERAGGPTVEVADDETQRSAPRPTTRGSSSSHGPRDPLSIEIRPGTGTGTGTEDPDPPPPSNRRVVALVAAVLLVVGVVAGSLIARAVDPFGAGTASAADDDAEQTTTTTAGDAAPLPTPPSLPPDCQPVELPGPDANDDGCPDEITLDGRVATVGDVEIELGQDGDLVSFADTDCDGIVTPVLLRPGSGEIFAFDEWSLSEPVEVTSIGVVDGAESIERGPEPCSPAVVTDSAGTEVEVPAR